MCIRPYSDRTPDQRAHVASDQRVTELALTTPTPASTITPMSTWGWIDFSSEDRARMRNVLAAVKDKATLDELGIGQLRDLYSELLFPGFSTIQTRSRYFLAIPKILRDWADHTPASRRRTPLASYLHEQENKLTRHLVDSYHSLKRKPEGVIGHTVVEKGGVQRRPSSTYWNGLRTFGIVRRDQSLAEFCREGGADGQFADRVSTDEGLDDEEHSPTDVLRPPDSNGGWREGLTLDLTKDEAIFLAGRFKMGGQRGIAVTGQLLETKLVPAALRCEDFEAFAAWARPNPRLDPRCAELVGKAWRFSLFVEGAHIVFNRLMAARLQHKPLKQSTLRKWDEWREKCRTERVFHLGAVAEWTSVLALSDRPVRLKCEDFLGQWNQAISEEWTLSRLETLVERRALDTKDNRSLLRRTSGLPRNAEWFGMEALDFRWGTAQRMLRDIHEAVK